MVEKKRIEWKEKGKKNDIRLTLFVKNKLREFDRNPKILRNAKRVRSTSPIQLQVYGHKPMKSNSWLMYLKNGFVQFSLIPFTVLMVWSTTFIDTLKDEKDYSEGLKKKIRYIKESIMKERENWFLWTFSRYC